MGSRNSENWVKEKPYYLVIQANSGTGLLELKGISVIESCINKRKLTFLRLFPRLYI
jgi:hypothetical protein